MSDILQYNDSGIGIGLARGSEIEIKKLAVPRFFLTSCAKFGKVDILIVIEQMMKIVQLPLKMI